jgi:superfamily II DNA or RNA helicase
MATALGKTVTSALAIKKVDTRPVIFLAHSKDILRGAHRDYTRIFPNLKFGTFHGNAKDIEGADIVFASLQSMYRNLSKFKPRQFRWLIFDESHHAHARTYLEVVEYFKCPRLALTATPNRMDLKDIRELFGEEVVNLPLEKAIAEGWLPRIEYHLVTDDALNERYLKQLAKQVLVAGERLPLDQIRKRLFVKTRDKKIAKIIEGYSEKTVVFCQSVAHANHFSKLLKSSAVYHSGQDWEKNKQALDDLRNGVVRRICVVDAFNEGIDVPDVGLVVFVRATQSETIFRQQLGRGLRRGKDKLIVLDFAGNIERIRMINRITRTIAQIHEEIKGKKELSREGYQRNPFLISGRGFEFTFSKQIVDIERIFDRLEVEFYSTWQEASQAAQKLGVRSQANYRRSYKSDPRLPSAPEEFYSDYPGDATFYRGETRIEKYRTWREASQAARKLNIKTRLEYSRRYKEDPHLILSVDSSYPDFPGFDIFLTGKSRAIYNSLTDAQRAARRLGFRNAKEYKQGYKKDPRLPIAPNVRFKNFPGWTKFLGTEKNFYSSWRSASRAVKNLNIRKQTEYFARYKEDSKLPSNPQTWYSNFPGWTTYLGIEKPLYKSWRSAAKAARKIGITTCNQYLVSYKKDPKLPSVPYKQYLNWPGWPKFLGTHKKKRRRG